MRYKKTVFAFVVLCLCFTAFTAESVALSAPAKATRVTVSASPPIPIDNRELRYDLTGSITTDGPTTVTITGYAAISKFPLPIESASVLPAHKMLQANYVSSKPDKFNTYGWKSKSPTRIKSSQED